MSHWTETASDDAGVSFSDQPADSAVEPCPGGRSWIDMDDVVEPPDHEIIDEVIEGPEWELVDEVEEPSDSDGAGDGDSGPPGGGSGG